MPGVSGRKKGSSRHQKRTILTELGAERSAGAVLADTEVALGAIGARHEHGLATADAVELRIKEE